MSSLLAAAGELCIVRSMYTDQPNHARAQLLMFNGPPRLGRPSMVAYTRWTGLGKRRLARVRRAVVWGKRRCGQERAGQWLAFHSSRRAVPDFRPPVLHAADPVGVDRMLRRESWTRWLNSPVGPPWPPRSRDVGPHRTVRIGLPYADGRAGGHRFPRKNPSGREDYGPIQGRTVLLPTTACSPAVWSNGEHGLCICSIGGDSTRSQHRHREGPSGQGPHDGQSRLCVADLRSRCSTTRSWCGVENLADVHE